MLKTKFKCENKQRAITQKLSKQELWFMCTALPLDEAYSSMKFHNHSWYSFGDMLRTKNWTLPARPPSWMPRVMYICPVLDRRIFSLKKDENLVGKERIGIMSSFPTMLSKEFYLLTIKTYDSVLKESLPTLSVKAIHFAANLMKDLIIILLDIVQEKST